MARPIRETPVLKGEDAFRCKTVTLRTRKIKGGDLSIPAKRGSGGLRAMLA